MVQFDLRTRTKKVIAKGETLYVTWNASRATGKAWDVVALTAIHIPASER